MFSVPVSKRPALVFNAHRVYSLEQMEKLTAGFLVAQETLIKTGERLMRREEAVSVLSRGLEDYLVWIGCVEKI